MNSSAGCAACGSLCLYWEQGQRGGHEPLVWEKAWDVEGQGEAFPVSVLREPRGFQQSSNPGFQHLCNQFSELFPSVEPPGVGSCPAWTLTEAGLKAQSVIVTIWPRGWSRGTKLTEKKDGSLFGRLVRDALQRNNQSLSSSQLRSCPWVPGTPGLKATCPRPLLP